MSLIMQKSYRSKLDSSINYTMVFAILFSFGLIAIGMASYVIPDFGLGTLESISLVVLGSGILLFSLSSIIMKVSTGMTRNVSLFLALLLVAFILVMMLIGSGILEVDI